MNDPIRDLIDQQKLELQRLDEAIAQKRKIKHKLDTDIDEGLRECGNHVVLSSTVFRTCTDSMLLEVDAVLRQTARLKLATDSAVIEYRRCTSALHLERNKMIEITSDAAKFVGKTNAICENMQVVAACLKLLKEIEACGGLETMRRLSNAFPPA